MRTILFILFPLYRCYSMTNTTSRVFFINEQYPRSVFECTKEKWAHKKKTKKQPRKNYLFVGEKWLMLVIRSIYPMGINHF